MTAPTRRNQYFAGAILLVLGIALLPWWRNHGYLRDLYDYGLVLAANGHLDLGERPYVDFTTPIQAGFLSLNWLIERLGGGNYFALTLGGAGLIAVTGVSLTLMLARRWAWWAAAVIGGVVTISAASQHTILWHNSLGVFCLALVTWSAACAPVWRRSAWPWHALLLAGLFLGGINKLNFHLVAVAVALAWAVRAGLVRQAGWGRVGATATGILLAGLVLPVAAELAWTGVSLARWLANVVQLASGSRLGILQQILSPDFLLRPIHDYYGPVPLPQAGLAGVVLSLAVLIGCWPAATVATARWDRWLVPLAAGAAATAGAALLATNFEIASVGLGAWLVLVASLWLGFAPAGRRLVFWGGLILPALVLGLAAWWSAWQGQRSQFGFSPAARAEYLPAEQAGPAFARLSGLRLPPDVVRSLVVTGQTLDELYPASDGAGLRPVFFGPGLEFMDRCYPTRRDKPQPLWAHWGTTYSPADMERLAGELGEHGRYQSVFVTAAFDSWPPPIQAQLDKHYVKDLAGPRIRRWARRDAHTVDLADCFAAMAALGGNVDSRLLLIDDYPLRSRQGADGRLVLGTSRGDGCMQVRAPSYRLRAVAVLERLPGSGDGPLFADFKAIIHGATPEERRWAARVELPAGQRAVSVPFEVEAGGRMLQLWVSQPATRPAVQFAGFRDLEITHAVESATAPQLRPASHAGVAATPELAAALFGSVPWRPQQLLGRGGQPAPAGVELAAGGELWWHTDSMTGEIRGQLSRANRAGPPVMARVLWYKGGRLQVLQQGWLPAGQPFDFHAWAAEPGGWIGVLLEPTETPAPVLVRVTGTTLTP
jgi:hypothetical protein